MFNAAMLPGKPRRLKLDAAPAYEHAHLIAQDLLARLAELLQDIPAPDAEGASIRWSQVGDITHVNGLLAEAATFLESASRIPAR